MVRPPSRRALLASVSTIAAIATGGFESPATGGTIPRLESGIVPADRYRCSDVTRPNPDTVPDDAALEPRAYPSLPVGADGDRPPSDRGSSLVARVTRSVVEFERAYRRNAFLERYGAAARTVTLRLTDHRAAPVESAADANAVLVALLYDLTTATRYSTAGPRDEWDIRVTYYVDENGAFRAQYDGIAETLAFEPDPRTQGTLVACVD